VTYARSVETDAQLNDDINAVPATRCTLPSYGTQRKTVMPISSWHIHHLGEEIEPAHVPRTATGFDPRTQA